MNVLQLVPTLQSGGAERLVVELTNCLNDREKINCDIGVLYPMVSNQHFSHLLNNVNVFSLNKKEGFSIKLLFSLYRTIKKGRYDVVHAHLNAIPYLLISALLCRKVKFIATIHSDAFFEASGNLGRYIRRFLFSFGLVTPVTISEESQTSFRKCYGIDAVMVKNAISPYTLNSSLSHNLRKSDRDIIFIHPASCQPVKNQELLLKAFNIISQKYPDVYLYWFGNNETHPQLFNDLSKYLTENIVYAGCTSDVRYYLSQADGMCLSSALEGMPMVIIESFSVGCIPITTPVGGCVNMIENAINGFISQDMSLDAYVNAIESVINLSNIEKQSMKQAGIRTFSEKYSIQTCVDDYIKLYLP